MKKFIPLMLMLLVPLSLFAAGKALKVSFTDGSSATYKLSETPKVTFSGADMLITTSTASTTHARSEVANLTFVDASDDPTAIARVKDVNNITYRFDNNSFEADGADISVYSTSGALVTEGKNAVSLQSLRSGIYIVKAGKQAIKINKK